MSDNEFQYHLLYLPRGISRLEQLGEVKKYPKDYELNVIDEVPDCCYIVKSGRVLCYEISYAGDQRVYNFMEAGSLFMEDCLLFHQPCPVMFKTMMPSELIKIDRCDLMRAFKSDIDTVMDVCESLVVKFLSAMEYLRLGPHQESSWKICKLILVFAKHYGEMSQKGEIVIKEKISHQMLADLLGLNRVTVSRKFLELKELGILGKTGSYYCIKDIELLHRHMAETT